MITPVLVVQSPSTAGVGYVSTNQPLLLPFEDKPQNQKVGMKSCILSRAFCAMHSAIHVMLRISCSLSLM